MPEHDVCTREVQHSEKVVDVVFPTGEKPAGVVEPGEEAFDLPAAATPP